MAAIHVFLPKLQEPLATSYLCCFQHGFIKWTCSQLQQAIISQAFIRLFHHLRGGINVKLWGGGGGGGWRQSDCCIISETRY